MSEHVYLARVEAAQPDELGRLLATATSDEQRLLRVYLGDERYRRMRALALQQRNTRSRAEQAGNEVSKPRGNVVVLHGIMGAELSRSQGHVPGGRGGIRQIWVKLWQLAQGDLRYLQLDDAGSGSADPRYEVTATGIMKKHYGEQLLTLAQHWEVRAFWYDWRRDLHEAARSLHLKLIEWFDGKPVHLVAHSMGGLVARTFIHDYPDHWKAMWDGEERGKRGGRLVMLGTPNHGSYAVPQILTGTEGLIRKLALVDLRHRFDDVLGIVNTFAGSYQMMPALHTASSDTAKREMERFYKAGMYDRETVSQHHLDAARAFHKELRDIVDPARMIYVAGYNQPTYAGIKGNQNWANFRSHNAKTARKAYSVTLDGDGRVPHSLGLLQTESGKKVPTYYVEEEHGALPENDAVLRALDDLLATGKTAHLAATLPKKRSRSKEEARDRMDEVERKHDAEMDRLRAHLSIRARTGIPDEPDLLAGPVTPGEREAEEMLTRGFLSARPSSTTKRIDMDAPFASPTLTVRVIHADIGEAHYLDGDPPVDAISVGHYRGVRPTNAVLALDKAISAARQGVASDEVEDGDLILTRLTERGTIRGDHAQPFFLPDYRAGKKDDASDRVVAIAGMGDPGRFGVPELTVLARELVWALGTMGKRHLASVLIGAGAGNLRIDEAVPAWIRGFKHALTGADESVRVEHLTFIEFDPAAAIKIDRALHAFQRELDPRRMSLNYTPFSVENIQKLQQAENDQRKQRLQREIERLDAGEDKEKSEQEDKQLAPTRLTVRLEGTSYRYGAITQDASVPEREIEVDPKLVYQANDRLAAERAPARQRDHGRMLEKLLIPHDLRPHLSSTAPLVLLLDASTARVHWEMMAQPDAFAAGGMNSDADAEGTTDEDAAFFLGISRGLTRQLRTQFAAPPEPPPPPRRVLRVLVVADPAEDAPLPGAEEEGMEVADLFEQFNTLYPDSENRIVVKRLLGPQEATRLNVMSELMLRSYDVLHFAGHCVYDPADPAASGWIFSNGERLSARELTRIDRIPGFVFSNACESGITPDRTRSADLAPSFAEAFFERGVKNFVCTAWPVDDLSARTFARELYAHLLWIKIEEEEGQDMGYARKESASASLMYLAMRDARRKIAETPGGLQTWGAYQHYGSPYFRFFGSLPVSSKNKAKRGASSAKNKRSDG